MDKEMVIDKNVPIVELQVSTNDIYVWDKVEYSIVSRVESDNEAFENNRTLQAIQTKKKFLFYKKAFLKNNKSSFIYRKKGKNLSNITNYERPCEIKFMLKND